MTEMDRLIDRYLDHDISDVELADLFEWVAADAANADFFAKLSIGLPSTVINRMQRITIIHNDYSARN